jgi:hypothetical protein
MNLLSKLSPTAKMILGVGAIIVSIIVVSVVSYQSMKHIHESGDKVYSSYLLTRDLAQLGQKEGDLSENILDIIIRKDSNIGDSTTKRIDRDFALIHALCDSINHDVMGNSEESVLKNELIVMLKSYEEKYRIQLNLIARGKFDEAYTLIEKELHPLDDSIKRKIESLEKIHDGHALGIMDENTNVLKTDLFILFLLSSIVVLISVIMAVWMVKMLHKITFEIKNGVTVLGTSAAEILSTVSEISTGATETATAISETTTTVEEVRQTAMVANQKARALMESSQKATDSADKGMESVQQVIESMKKIDKQMNIIAETVVKLSEQNRSIGEITSTVTDIADQSNLLAVNAAIEAAKAGEQGRGFAVVAQEIRSLADQSKKATIQIKEILNEIQKSVNLSVDVTEKGSSTVAEGILLVTKSGNVIGALAEHVEAAVQISVQISSSSQQQMAGMEQVVPAMENIKQASEQNVAGIRQAQGAATDLNLLGQKIHGIIEKYNL